VSVSESGMPFCTTSRPLTSVSQLSPTKRFGASAASPAVAKHAIAIGNGLAAAMRNRRPRSPIDSGSGVEPG
jgi:hypothetical protein